MTAMWPQGTDIKLNGQPLERDPVSQVVACFAEIKQLIKKGTGKNYAVKPVVLFPGWYVASVDEGNKGETWALNPKAFPKFIERRPTILADDEIHLLSMHLSIYVRENLKAA